MQTTLQKVKQVLRRSPILFSILKKITGTEKRKNLARAQEWEEIQRTVDSQSIRVLDFSETRPASFEQPVSQAATYEQMTSEAYKQWCEKLNEETNYHRKSWEYAYILQCLETKGKIFKNSKGLGFGVGQEPIVAYLAKMGCQILATDLDPHLAAEKGWVESGEYSKKLLDLNQRSVCSDDTLRKQVELKIMDMNSISPEVLQGEYDFVWSACALEHLGTLENGIQFMLNSVKALKPGGVAVHTTEFNVSSNEETIESGGTVLYRKRDIEKIADLLRAEGYKIQLNFDLGKTKLDQYYDVAPFSNYHHLRLQLEKYVITSFGFLIHKP